MQGHRLDECVRVQLDQCGEQSATRVTVRKGVTHQRPVQWCHEGLIDDEFTGGDPHRPHDAVRIAAPKGPSSELLFLGEKEACPPRIPHQIGNVSGFTATGCGALELVVAPHCAPLMHGEAAPQTSPGAAGTAIALGEEYIIGILVAHCNLLRKNEPVLPVKKVIHHAFYRPILAAA